MKKLVWLLAAILFGSGSDAVSIEVEETWNCFAPDDNAHETVVAVLVKERAMNGAVAGTVKLDGVAYDSEFAMTGSQRRWDFAGDRHAIIVDADGTARFFDFSDEVSGQPVEASRFFRCNLM